MSGKRNSKTTENFYCFPKKFMYSEYIISDGVKYTFNIQVKCVYVHMRDQYTMRQEQQETYFESQQTLANKLGFSLSTVKKGMKQLIDSGLVEVVGKKNLSNVLKVYDFHEKNIKFSCDEGQEPKKPKPRKKKPEYQKPEDSPNESCEDVSLDEVLSSAPPLSVYNDLPSIPEDDRYDSEIPF